MMRSGRSIVTRLVVVTALAGLLTGLVGVFLVRYVQTRELRSEAAARNLAHAERVATLLEGRVEALHGQLSLLAATEPVASLSDDASTELSVMIRVSDDLDEVFLFRADGQPVAAAASAQLLELEDVPDRRGLVGSAARPEVHLFDERRLPALELIVPVENPPGTLVGALVARAPLDLLAREAEVQLPGSSARAFLLDGDGTVVAHRDQVRVLERHRFGSVSELATNRTLVVDQGGQGRVLLAAAPVGVFDGLVVVEQPEAAAVAPVATSISETTLVFTAVVAAIVLAVILFGNRLLRPIRPIADAVNRLEQGDLSTRVDAQGVGEVGVLASGFNRMAASLEERQQQLASAERAARMSEQRLRLLVEGVEDYAIVLLDPEGVIRSWNAGAHAVLGARHEQAIGRRLSHFFDRDEPPRDPLALAADSGRGASEGWLRREDGRQFWAQLSVSELHDEGEPYGYAAVVHDLTDRHAAQEALRTALEREQLATEDLRRTNAAKSEFLAIAAHELQTPLAVILGASGVLVDDQEIDPEDREQLLRAIDKHASDMRRIVERLLELSRLQTGRVELRVEKFRLDTALRDDIERLRQELTGHQVHVEAPAADVRTDPAALSHIVSNLLSNAAKFSPQGSRIGVRANVTDLGFEVVVSDEGSGISPEELEQVFEPFRHGNQQANARGAGVGLTIVDRYVDLLGGSLDVGSAPGGGCVVTVRLPFRTA